MRRAVRVAQLPWLLALVAAGLLPAGAVAGAEQAPAARVVLVSPANGALIQRSHVTFVWRVESHRPLPPGTVQVSHREAALRGRLPTLRHGVGPGGQPEQELRAVPGPLTRAQD